MTVAHVLVVDDDVEIRAMLRRVLLAERYDVDTAATATDGLRLARERQPDVIVMDIGLPDLDGVEAVDQLRGSGRWTPVLMLTAHGDLERRLDSFRVGADDFLAKPFHLEELLARLDALVRRGRAAGPADTHLRRGELLLDTEARRCWRGEREIELSPREFDLLEYLARNAGQALSRDQIIDRIWQGHVTEGSNPVDVYVGYLRRKLEQGGASRLIRTVRGRGFMLVMGRERRAMTLRARLSIILAAGVAVAGIAFILLARVTVEQALYADVDRELQREIRMFDADGRGRRGNHDGPRPGFGREAGALFGPGALIAQITTRDGEVELRTSGVEAIGGLPAPRIANAERESKLRTVRIDDARYRLIEANVRGDRVVQIARPLAEIAGFLDVLRWILLAALALALAAAVLLGRWAARATLAPVALMTHTAERIARDPQQLSSERIEPAFADPELSSFAGAVNGMLDAIDAAQQQQRRFVADASHELRTPLTSLGGNAAYLERHGGPMDPVTRDAVAAVRRDVTRVQRIADGLTVLARLDAIPALQREPVQIDAVVHEAIAQARLLHPDHAFKLSGNAGTYLLDMELTRRIVGNLLDNAGRYTPAGSTVRVTVAAQDDVCRIEVCDNGPGMSAQERERVLGRFQRGSAAAGTSGSGLGLAIVQDAARALDGTFALESCEPHGLCCIVELPTGSAA